MTQLTTVKENIHEHKDKSCNPKKHNKTQSPTGLYELFLLTVPIEEVVRCQYKIIKIIFPLNLQTITAPTIHKNSPFYTRISGYPPQQTGRYLLELKTEQTITETCN